MRHVLVFRSLGSRLAVHPQFAARAPDNKLILAEPERDVLLMGDSKVPERAFGAVLKGVLESSNKRGVGEIEVLNRGAGIVE